jgi:hypothetical protein
MREVIANPYRTDFGSMADDPPKRGTGWVEPRGLESPAGQDHIERLANSFQPHGLGNSAHPLAKVVEEALAKLKVQQAEKGEKSGESWGLADGSANRRLTLWPPKKTLRLSLNPKTYS